MTEEERLKREITELDAQLATLDNPVVIKAVEAHLLALQEQLATLTGDISGRDIDGSAITGKVETGGGNFVGRDSNQTINHIFNQFTHPPENRDQLADQLIAYLQWVREWSSMIELRGIKREGESVIQLPLETAYVPLQVSGSDQHEIYSQVIVLFLIDRLVITGGPGSGKTTFLLYIAWILAETILTDRPVLALEELNLNLWGEQPIPIPIFVSISQYAYYLRHETDSDPQKKTLAYFLTHYLIQQQAHLKGGTDFLTALLDEGQTIFLLLDGLDEVPDEADRAFVTKAIDHLVMTQTQIRVVVTCRTAAYGGRTALERGFQTVQMQALGNYHIRHLIQQAYACIYPKNTEEWRTKSQDLINGIANLEERRRARLGQDTKPLVDSPLWVRRSMVVHFSERRLPDHRAELYMKVTDTLLLPEYVPDSEVANRLGAMIGGSWEVHREMVQHLAFHMHQRGEEQGWEIDEDEVRAVLQQEADYATAIDPFIHITRLRGTLLEERLGLYRFIDPSLQEYLVARYLVEVVGGVKEIVSFLAEGPILQRWWREVVLMTVGYLSVTTSHVARQLLKQMVGETDVTHYSAKVQLALAELAFVAVREWQEWHPHEFVFVEQQLLTLFTDHERMAQVPIQQRVAVGITLAEVGDPRPYVLEVDAMRFCYVPKGAFYMGSDEGNSDEKPLHRLEIPYDYWLGQYPVTDAQFEAFIDSGGYEREQYWTEAQALGYWQAGQGFKEMHEREWRKRPLYHRYFSLSNYPVVAVSWYESLAFCRWLTEQLPEGWLARLPTEAEWEKGARGGLQIPAQPYYQPLSQLEEKPSPLLIDNLQPTRQYVWGDELPQNMDIKGIGTVGCFPMDLSVYGCAEMNTNIEEWMQTKWGYDYPYQSDDGRETIDTSNDDRVFRGSLPISVLDRRPGRCSFRDLAHPLFSDDDCGFRVCVLPPFSETR